MKNRTDPPDQALFESRQRLERLTNSVPVMLYDSVMDPDGASRFLYVAPKPCREILELDPDALLRDMSLVWALVHPDDLGRFSQEDLAANRSGQVFSSELRIITPSGRLKWLLVNSKPNPAAPGEPVIWSGYLQDITARKQAEEALRESEYFFKETQRSASIGSYKADLIADSWESSEVLDTIFGIGPDYHRTIQGWVELVHPDDRAELENYLFSEVIEQRRPFTREYRIVRQNDCAIRWVKGLGALRTGTSAQHLLLMGTIQDITEQKIKEEEKTRIESQLLQSQKIESVGRLAGGVAHDFNNMLSVILGHVEMAQRKADVSPPLREHLAQIQTAAERSTDIVRQLLAFARKQTVSPRLLNLNETIQDMLKMLRRLIGEEIELVWNADQELWPVMMDPAQVDQILANLCVNARDAIDRFGRIIIEIKNTRCDQDDCNRLTGLSPGDYVLLTVRDNGCGMDREILEDIFEPFFTTKELGQGTGLGLATVYGIVKQNAGYIDVTSEPGQGASFNIYLPRHTGKEAQPRATGATPPSQRGKETVLLVEDEPAILDVAQQMLELQGYRVLVADTPGAAIRLAETYAGEIHLLLTDVVMPEMNGRELAKKLLSFYPNLRQLYMSGYTANVIAHHGVLDEGVMFIQKPFTLNALAVKVREVLD